MRTSGTELINPFKVLERVGIQPGWRVADLGCGALGHFVFPAAQLVGGDGRVYAIDIQKSVLRAIERMAKTEQFWNVVPVWSDIDVFGAARIPPDSLDLCILANNLYLSQNRDGLIREALRLLKPSGLLLVIEWKKEPTTLGPAMENRLGVDEAKRILQMLELRPIESFDAGDHHYALVYQKAGETEPRIESISKPLT